MAYVIRDETGAVIALAALPLDDAAEELDPTDPEVLGFIAQVAELGQVDDPFLAADLDFIRVSEDLIEVLIKKGIIALADLPPEAQDKLMRRRALRHSLGGTGGLVDEG